jgi:hypothetical protein
MCSEPHIPRQRGSCLTFNVGQNKMSFSDIKSLSEKQLLQVTGDIIDELVSRGVCRTENNPISDYTEWLVASRLNLTLATSSARGFDAVGPNQEKYEMAGCQSKCNRGWVED